MEATGSPEMLVFVYQTTWCGPGSSVGIVTGYRLEGWMVRGSNPSGDEIFRTCPDRPWDPPSPLYMGTGSFPGCDADLSPLSSAEV
jgi:hypothetical protein